MRPRVPLLIPLAALAAAAAGAAPASAATPLDLGPAAAVDVAVDALGAAHVVATDPSTHEMRYCLVPRGGTGCTRQTTLALPGDGQREAAHVQVDGARILVTAVRYDTGSGEGDGPVVAISNDGGQTFGWGVRTGSDTIYGGQQALGPDGGLWNAYSSSLHLWTTRIAPDGSAPISDWQVKFDDAESSWRDGGIAVAGNTVIATRAGAQPSFFTHLIGSGDANLRAGWSGAGPIPLAAGSEWMANSSMAGGPAGAVMTATEGAGLSAAIMARRWTGSGFAAPVELYRHSGGSNNAANGEVAADATGGIHAVYAGDNDAWVRYSFSPDGGVSWGPSHLIETQDGSTPRALRVAAAPDHQGFAAYIRENRAMLVPLEPIAPPTEPVPPVTPAPPVTPVTPIAPAPPVAPAPAAPKRKTTTTKVRVGNSDLVLGLPAGCLAPGSVRVTFKVQARKVKKAKRRAGRVVVKVRRVTFTVDGKRRKTDRKAPFVQTLRLQKLKPGTTHVVRARAELKQKQKGPKRYRTVTRKVRICA